MVLLNKYIHRELQESVLENFNPEQELTMIAEVRRIAQRRAYRVIKLNEFRSKLVDLQRSNASLADIAT